MSEEARGANSSKEPLLPSWVWRISAGIILISVASEVASGLFCSNAISYQQPSPNGQLTAVVFMRHCGSMSGDSPQISVVDPDDPIRKSDSGNVFIGGDKQPAKLALRWKDPSTLIVTRDPSMVISKEEKLVTIWKFPLPQFVAIEYQDSEL